MSNVKQAVPLFAVSNIDESLRYYVDGLGFEMILKWIDEGKLRWCWLQNGGAGVMLQEFRTEGPEAWVPSGKLGEGVSICFICDDAVAFYREVTAKGIEATRHSSATECGSPHCATRMDTGWSSRVKRRKRRIQF